jgi:hypothetical protein
MRALGKQSEPGQVSESEENMIGVCGQVVIPGRDPIPLCLEMTQEEWKEMEASMEKNRKATAGE